MAARAQELQRKFSFFSTDDKAEVQLGGYDPATCDDEMDYTPSLSPTDFIVGVTSLKFGHPGSEGHQELLKFNECVPAPPRPAPCARRSAHCEGGCAAPGLTLAAPQPDRRRVPPGDHGLRDLVPGDPRLAARGEAR